ncbi:glycosyltransferase family 2 protein [Deinococcus sp. PEB2-63]
MKEEHMVTIAIPVFNGEKHIGDAIKSILSQRYTNWELLIMDDGSEDKSLDICQSFDDPRIKIFKDGFNKGISHRLNESVRLARGNFYARMDADDIMSINRISCQMQYMNDNPECDVVGSAAYIIDGNNSITGLRSGNTFANQTFASVLSQGGFMHPTVLGRTIWFRSNPYDVNADRCEDIELWLRTVDHSKFGHIANPLLFYREEGDQSSKVEKTVKGYIEMLQNMSMTVRPEYQPLLRSQQQKAIIKLWISRIAHRIGLEKTIVAARSQRLTDIQHQKGHIDLQKAISCPEERIKS